jgi:hypothetical protein
MLSVDQIHELFNPPTVELPNRLREQLLKTGRGQAVMVLDAAYHSDMKPNTKFTYDQLWANIGHFGMAPRLVRNVLADPLFIPAGHDVTGKRGRPQRVYKLPDVAHVAASSGAGFSATVLSDPLSPLAFKSLTQYRKELHYRLIEREPGQYSRALLSKRLGVSKRTTRAYDKLLDIKVTPKTMEQEIPFHYVGVIPSERPPKGAPRYQWLETVKNNEIVRGPLVRGLAIKWLEEGHTVWRVSQTTNHYDLPNRYITGKYAALMNY